MVFRAYKFNLKQININCMFTLFDYTNFRRLISYYNQLNIKITSKWRKLNIRRRRKMFLFLILVSMSPNCVRKEGITHQGGYCCRLDTQACVLHGWIWRRFQNLTYVTWEPISLGIMFKVCMASSLAIMGMSPEDSALIY